MIIPLSFIQNLNIPSVAWNVKYFNDKFGYTLTSKIYKQIFWYSFWKNLMCDTFKNQNMITYLGSIDLDYSVFVYITDDGEINLILPTILEYVSYFYDLKNKDSLYDSLKKLALPISSSTILFVYIVSMLVIYLLVSGRIPIAF